MGDAEDRDEERDDKDEEREEKDDGDSNPEREAAIRQGKDAAARRAEGLEEGPEDEEEEEESADAGRDSGDAKSEDEGAEREREDADRADEEDEDEEKSRRWPKVLGALAALVAIVVIVVVVAGGDDKEKPPTTTTQREAVAGPIIGGSAVEKRYGGVEQDGFALGAQDAPVTLVEFGDLQCALCKNATENSLPPLIDQYVKDGRLRIEFRNYAIVGPDSTKAAKALEGAADQDRAWQFIELWYLNQGAENSGYVTDDFIRRVGRAARIPDIEKIVVESNSEEAGGSIADAKSEAKDFGIDSAPSYLIGRTGDELAQLQIADPGDPSLFTQAVENLLEEN